MPTDAHKEHTYEIDVTWTGNRLHPEVTLNDEPHRDRALTLHDDAHHHCFIASSVNFPVRCEPSVQSVSEQVA